MNGAAAKCPPCLLRVLSKQGYPHLSDFPSDGAHNVDKDEHIW